MAAHAPPGGPSGVPPPGSEDFERTAQAWLLDVVPPDYRLHGVLRRYPLALAAMAAHHTKACVAGAREGYRNARTEVGGALPPHALEALLPAHRAEGRRPGATGPAGDLLARARPRAGLPPRNSRTPHSPADGGGRRRARAPRTRAPRTQTRRIPAPRTSPAGGERRRAPDRKAQPTGRGPGSRQLSTRRPGSWRPGSR